MRARKIFVVAIILFLCLNLIGCVAPIQKPIAYRVEVYFSPVGHVRDHITDAIDNSRTSIDIAIFDFTSQEIKASLEKVKEKGGKIRIIADSKQYKGSHSVIQSLIDSGFDVKITHGKGRGIMHNKFAILDTILLFAGSYNWTDNAKHFNYENAVFISEAEVIKQYQKEFDKIWSST